MDQGLTVGEMATKIGLSAHTLRWYEQMGLLDPVPRDSAGRRRYGQHDVDRLDLLTKMRATGMPVRDMVRYIELVRAGDGSRPARLAMLEAHRHTVLKQIDELQRDLSVIDRKIGLYRDSLPQCEI
ncbi:MerR family transcriptional regulator [Allorhizocola rhizosphaerae]|uniref:MerR family transcriptional regulator n=1 Tax=Allorhizocola rhizosphaerae TaxID=1872709 RepID=UPI000E3EDABA|nr:MerR family transcriptional regulator [Allorhizocola rhizosphaerae]